MSADLSQPPSAPETAIDVPNLLAMAHDLCGRLALLSVSHPQLGSDCYSLADKLHVAMKYELPSLVASRSAVERERLHTLAAAESERAALRGALERALTKVQHVALQANAPLTDRGVVERMAIEAREILADALSRPSAAPSEPGSILSGVDLIAAERKRQVDKEGWDAAHDDTHTRGEMAITAACYAVEGTGALVTVDGCEAWPWGSCDDKRNQHSPVRRLVIAGALIAAEIDRLSRAAAWDERAERKHFTKVRSMAAPNCHAPTTEEPHDDAREAGSPERRESRRESRAPDDGAGTGQRSVRAERGERGQHVREVDPERLAVAGHHEPGAAREVHAGSEVLRGLHADGVDVVTPLLAGNPPSANSQVTASSPLTASPAEGPDASRSADG